MTTATIDKTKLTPCNPANEREVEMMLGKAMCAYANWQRAEAADYYAPEFRHESQYEVVAAHRSEYEATVRCIAMFVRESVTSICIAVIERCKREFDV